MTRVLEIFGEPLATGGQETYVISHVSNMDRTNLQIDVLTCYTCENERQREAIEAWGGRVFELGLEFNPGRSREGIAQPLRQFLGEHRYDIVHVHSGSMSVLAIASMEAKRCGVQKVIVHSHCGGETFDLKKRLVRAVNGMRMAGNVDVYCACSHVAGSYMFLPRAQQRMTIMRNGVDTKRFSFSLESREELRAEAGVSDSTLVIGNVGRLDTQKNQPFLLDVFKQLHDVFPDSCLWIVGDGPKRADLEMRATQLGLEDCVTFWGVRSDVERLLSAMDVYLFPSRWEGLPIAMLEAECAGLPCVASQNVSHETDLSEGYVTHLPLDAPIAQWVECVLDYAGTRNQDAVRQISNAGYDITGSAAQLRRLYCSIDQQSVA